MPRVTVLSIIALLLTSSFAWATESPVVVPGARLRITELGLGKSGRHAGTVVTAGTDTVVLRLDRGEGTAPYSLAKTEEIALSRGRHGHVVAGLGLGFLAGAGTGALVGASGNYGGGEDAGIDKILNTLAWSGIGAGVGMLVGGIVGAMHKTERWEALPSSRWRLTAGPARGGLTIVLAYGGRPQAR